MLKKYLKNIAITLLFILSITFILNTFYYFNIIGDKLMLITMFLACIICILISAYKFSKIDKSRGFLSGLKIGIAYVILFLIISLIFDKFNLVTLIYYIFIIILSMVGGILSNYNKEKK